MSLTALAANELMVLITSRETFTFIQIVNLVDVLLGMATNWLIDWFIVTRQFRQLLSILDVPVVHKYMWTTSTGRALLPLHLELVTAVVMTSINFVSERHLLYGAVSLLAAFKVTKDLGVFFSGLSSSTY